MSPKHGKRKTATEVFPCLISLITLALYDHILHPSTATLNQEHVIKGHHMKANYSDFTTSVETSTVTARFLY